MSLFDLGKDVSEKDDLAKQMPEKVAELTKLHDEWLAQMANPLRGGAKRFGITASSDGAPAKPAKMTREEKKKQRDMERARKRQPAPPQATK